MYLIVVFIHFATVFVNWAYQWYIICSSSDWVDYKQVGESLVTTTTLASQPLYIGVSICLKAYTFGLALIVVFENPKRCCQLPNLPSIPQLYVCKMRLWEFDGGICDSTAWKAINNCTHIPLRHCVLHSCHWYIQ